MDLRITRSHTIQGLRMSANSCPTALAAYDAGFESVYVRGEVCAYAGSDHFDGRISKKLSKAIKEFDGGKPFPPGVYRIPGLKKPKKGASR